MEQNVCLNCGTPLDRRDTLCPACGLPEIKADSPKTQKLLSSAFALLHESKFDKAKKAFEDILKKDCENAFAYWGRLRARYHSAYTRNVAGKCVPRPATRSAAALAEDIDYRYAALYGGEEMKAFLSAEAEYLRSFCTAPDVGASKNITHQFTMGEVDLNDGLTGKLKNPRYTLYFSQKSDGTYKVTGIKIPNKAETKVILPFSHNGEAVTEIGVGAFRDCGGMRGIVVPEGVTDIACEAFCGCTALADISLPESVTSIGYEAFRGCTALTDVTVPDGVTDIGESAFRDCGSLKTVSLPRSLTGIGEYAFRDCKSLKNVFLPESVTEIGAHAFWGCTSLTDIVIPEGVTVIDDYTFWGCTALKDISIPRGVTEIGNWAFWGCTALKKIILPESATVIGNYAFCDCKKLNTVSMQGSVTGIGDHAFWGCAALTDIAIPEGVTVIEDWTFCDCKNLSDIAIPAGLTNIGEYAFCDCGSLTAITFGGTRAQWKAIKRDENWNKDTDEYTVTCVDGMISKKQS